jgi:hypothetical protein
MKRHGRFVTWAGAALGVAALGLVAGCSAGGSSSGGAGILGARAPIGGASATTVPQPSNQIAPTAGGQTDSVPVPKADIISTGSIGVVVGKGALDHAFSLASQDAIGAGGFVASSDSQTSGTKPYADLVLRVPEARFVEVASEVAGLGKVQREELQGQDVTGQVVDLGARIANLRSEETALRQLMARTGSIPNILAVENQLFSVQQQIEELTAQRSNLVGQVAYATLTVDLTATPVSAKAKPKPQPTNAVARGAQLALHNTAATLHAVALAAGFVFPLLVVGIVALVLFEVRRRRRLHPASS